MNDKMLPKFSIQSYLDKNRDKIDESLVSLRIIKHVDVFLENNGLTNRELSDRLGYSESYISQLMSGVKKINVSFINKFEKSYNVKFDFKICHDKYSERLNILNEKSSFNIINIESNFIIKTNDSITTTNTVGTAIIFKPIEDIEYETL